MASHAANAVCITDLKSRDCPCFFVPSNQSATLAFAFGLAAEIERQLISERTKSSLANIKANGKKLGRPFSAATKKLKLAKNQQLVQKLLAQGISKSKIAKLFGVERATLRKHLL